MIAHWGKIAAKGAGRKHALRCKYVMCSAQIFSTYTTTRVLEATARGAPPAGAGRGGARLRGVFRGIMLYFCAVHASIEINLRGTTLRLSKEIIADIAPSRHFFNFKLRVLGRKSVSINVP
jgi:hypothetical protein